MKVNQIVKTNIPVKMQHLTNHAGLVRIRAIHKTGDGNTKVFLYGFGGSLGKRYLSEDIDPELVKGISECGECQWLGFVNEMSPIVVGGNDAFACPACGGFPTLSTKHSIIVNETKKSEHPPLREHIEQIREKRRSIGFLTHEFDSWMRRSFGHDSVEGLTYDQAKEVAAKVSSFIDPELPF